MASNKLNYDLTVTTKDAEKNLKAASKEAKKLGTDLDDTRSAGQKLAAAMDEVTGNAEREFKDAARAADLLGEKLGTDVVADLNASGRSIDDLVADLKRAGLTYNDIEADADALASSIKRAADVGRDIDTHVTKNMANVAKETDNSRSVMANFIGNASQELPLVGGAFGPLNMAIGQFAEYATEGNIKMGELVKFAGPMAGIALVMGVMAKHQEQMAKSKAFHAERVKAFADALRDGASAAEVWNAALEDKDPKFEFVDAATGDIADLTHTLAENDVTYQQFMSHVDDGPEKFEAWARSVFSGAEGSKDLNWALQAGWQIIEDHTKAVATAAETEEVFATALDETTTQADVTKKAIEDLDRKTQKFLGHLDANDALDALMDDFDNVGQAATDAWNATQAGEPGAEKAVRDHAAAVRDLKRDAVDAFDQLGTPVETQMDILTLIDQGKYAEAKAAIAEIERPSTKYVSVVVNQGKTFGGFKSATGRTNFSGVTQINEQGPEMVTDGQGNTFLAGNNLDILSAQKTRDAIGQATPTVINDNRIINVTIPNQTPEATAARIARFDRRNGRS